MNKFIYILFAICLLATNVCWATRHATIIGIGDYPIENGWKIINGDNDIPLVREMLLVNGFLLDDIHELKNAEATADAIRREFDRLIDVVQKEDVVYVHFSGHGQQITDLNGDEEDGYDEAWIPFDAQLSYTKGVYEGENHILDDEIHQYLLRLKQCVGEKGKIIVVADACHSGDSWRSEEQDTVVIRGVSDKFILPTYAQQYIGHKEHIDWIVISACKSYQCNYEYNGAGSLTYTLNYHKENLSKIPCAELKDSIKTILNKLIPFPQSPIVEISDTFLSLPIF